jgi:cyclopropane-fatty-acyl-phospholipid synthase
MTVTTNGDYARERSTDSGIRLAVPHAMPGLNRWTRAAFRMLAGIAVGRLTVVLPDGRSAAFDSGTPGPDATVRLRDLGAIKRFILGGDLAFAEAYMDGAIESPDPVAVVELFVHNKNALNQGNPQGLIRVMARRIVHWLNGNTRRGSRRNIAYHYDLGNAFYARWLDPSMTYSAARFEGSQQNLEAAQIAKYRRMAEKLQLQPGQRVLEIGCGWGGFAVYAAQEFGVEVHGITLSSEQHAYAVERAREAGVDDRVSFEIRDYRDLEGRFDAIASIEMFEAVGRSFWTRFFAQLHDRLVDGGRAALQVITISEAGFDDYRASPDFIQRYIFPAATSESLVRRRACASMRRRRSDSTMPGPWRNGGSGSWKNGRRSNRWVSTSGSAGCGTTTSPIVRAGSAAATSTSARSPTYVRSV